MIGKTVRKKCTACGREWDHITGSRLVRGVPSSGSPAEFKDSLTIINDTCGCPDPKEFTMKV